jgi:hypothetical protein
MGAPRTKTKKKEAPRRRPGRDVLQVHHSLVRPMHPYADAIDLLNDGMNWAAQRGYGKVLAIMASEASRLYESAWFIKPQQQGVVVFCMLDRLQEKLEDFRTPPNWEAHFKAIRERAVRLCNLKEAV